MVTRVCKAGSNMKNIVIALMIAVAILFAAETALAATGTISGTIIPFSITSSPGSPVNGKAPCEKTFSVEVGEPAQISWYFDGNREKTSSNTTTSSFTKTASEGTPNVTVVASNENGTVTETWNWNVQPKPKTTKKSSGGGGGGGGGGGIPPLSTEISSPKTIKAGSDFNVSVNVDYYGSTEVNVNAPEGWEVVRENGTDTFTLIPPEDAEGNYTIWVNTTTPFNTKREELNVEVEPENQQISTPVIKTPNKETIQTQTTQTPFSVTNSTPTPTTTTQVLESRMIGDIIDRITSGLQAFAGSIFKIFAF